jgi:hypothetical protein
MKFTDLKPGDHFVVATNGMRGHFACEMWINNVDTDDEGNLMIFPEPWQSDPCSFNTRELAVEYARKLAIDLKLPYID